MNWFWIYFLISGLLLCLYTDYVLKHRDWVLSVLKDENEKDDFEKLLDQLEYMSLSINIYPLLYCLCMLFGWILLPYTLLERFIYKIF